MIRKKQPVEAALGNRTRLGLGLAKTRDEPFLFPGKRSLRKSRRADHARNQGKRLIEFAFGDLTPESGGPDVAGEHPYEHGDVHGDQDQ